MFWKVIKYRQTLHYQGLNRKYQEVSCSQNYLQGLLMSLLRKSQWGGEKRSAGEQRGYSEMLKTLLDSIRARNKPSEFSVMPPWKPQNSVTFDTGMPNGSKYLLPCFLIPVTIWLRLVCLYHNFEIQVLWRLVFNLDRLLRGFPLTGHTVLQYLQNIWGSAHSSCV